MASSEEQQSFLLTNILIPKRTQSVSFIPPLMKNDEVISLDEYDQQPLLPKRRSTRTILMANVSRRLRQRKALHNRL